MKKGARAPIKTLETLLQTRYNLSKKMRPGATITINTKKKTIILQLLFIYNLLKKFFNFFLIK